MKRREMTLDQFVNADSPWPEGAKGFRTRRGQVIWETAHYPDKCAGHLVCVSRIVHENIVGRGLMGFSRTAYYDRDTEIEFVFHEEENK